MKKETSLQQNLLFDSQARSSSFSTSEALTVNDALEGLLQKARAVGASHADAVFSTSTEKNVAVRACQVEEATTSVSRSVSLRVVVQGNKVAVVTSDRPLTAAHQHALVEEAAVRARHVPQDPYFVMAQPGQFTDNPAVMPCANEPLSLEQLQEKALQCEEAALAVSGVTETEGAEAGYSYGETHVMTSQGFSGYHAGQSYSIGASVLAGDTQATRQRDAYGHSACLLSTWEDPVLVGKTAGMRAVQSLHPKPIPETGRLPVLLESRLAPSLLRIFLSAIHGEQVAKGMTFLRDKLNQQVFAQDITIVDNPHKTYTFGACFFDGEGLPTKRNALIEEGVLKTWLLNLRAAKMLDLSSTAHATLGAGGAPGIGAHHVYMEQGAKTPQQLMQDAGKGVLITEILGSTGVNVLTGDYTVGARGFWFQDGAIAHPVEKLTLAGHLGDVFRHMVPANDLQIRGSVNAPTLCLSGLTVSS